MEQFTEQMALLVKINQEELILAHEVCVDDKGDIGTFLTLRCFDYKITQQNMPGTVIIKPILVKTKMK